MITRDESSKSFSIKARLKSLEFAWDGLKTFFATQHNAVIHFYMTVFVFLGAVFFDLSRGELLAVILATGLVWSAELFNTAIEKVCDTVSNDFHPSIKFIKDVSAAAVLISAIAALVVGVIVFLPKILTWVGCF